jgi:hypothetical protein
VNSKIRVSRVEKSLEQRVTTKLDKKEDVLKTNTYTSFKPGPIKLDI